MPAYLTLDDKMVAEVEKLTIPRSARKANLHLLTGNLLR